MPGLTDAQMAALEAAQPKGLSDDEMASLETEANSKTGTLKRWGSNALQAAAKAGGVLQANTTGPAIGSLLEMTGNGKPAYSGQDVLNADDPTNLKRFPGVADMAERTGHKNPALSDALPGMYAQPGKGEHWYSPEKGGKLDPTAYGTLGVLSDPALWVGAGEGGAAAKVLAAHKAANASLPMKALSMAQAPVEAAAKAVGSLTGARSVVAPAFDMGMTALDSVPAVGGYLSAGAKTAVNPLGAAVTKAGKYLYGTPLLPVAQEGEKFGKTGINDDLFQAGIKTPVGLADEANKAARALGQAKEALITQAGDAPGNIASAVQPAREAIDRIRAIRDPGAQSLANDLEERLSGYLDEARGRPAGPEVPGSPEVPPSFESQPSPLVDEQGQPIMRQVQTSPGRAATPSQPGTPAIPPKPFTATDMDRLKSYFYRKNSPANWKQGAPLSSEEQAFNEAMGGGLKDATEATVEQATPGAGDALKDINRAYGGLKSTQTAQRTVGRQGDRLAHSIGSPTGVDQVAAMLGGNPGGIMEKIGLNKLGYAARFGTMPAGYGLQSLGGTGIVDRLNKMMQDKRDQANGKK